MFFVDLFLTIYAALHAQHLHGWWAALTVLILLFSILRITNGLAVNLGWGWIGYGIKAVVFSAGLGLIFAEA